MLPSLQEHSNKVLSSRVIITKRKCFLPKTSINGGSFRLSLYKGNEKGRFPLLRIFDDTVINNSVANIRKVNQRQQTNLFDELLFKKVGVAAVSESAPVQRCNFNMTLNCKSKRKLILVKT